MVLHSEGRGGGGVQWGKGGRGGPAREVTPTAERQADKVPFSKNDTSPWRMRCLAKVCVCVCGFEVAHAGKWGRGGGLPFQKNSGGGSSPEPQKIWRQIPAVAVRSLDLRVQDLQR